jgi:hypothetical protein
MTITASAVSIPSQSSGKSPFIGGRKLVVNKLTAPDWMNVFRRIEAAHFRLKGHYGLFVSSPVFRISEIVNDKGRYHSLSSQSTFAGSLVMLGRAAE